MRRPFNYAMLLSITVVASHGTLPGFSRARFHPRSVAVKSCHDASPRWASGGSTSLFSFQSCEFRLDWQCQHAVWEPHVYLKQSWHHGGPVYRDILDPCCSFSAAGRYTKQQTCSNPWRWSCG